MRCVKMTFFHARYQSIMRLNSRVVLCNKDEIEIVIITNVVTITPLECVVVL